jgi:hypothetical protein
MTVPLWTRRMRPRRFKWSGASGMSGISIALKKAWIESVNASGQIFHAIQPRQVRQSWPWLGHSIGK